MRYTLHDATGLQIGAANTAQRIADIAKPGTYSIDHDALAYPATVWRADIMGLCGTPMHSASDALAICATSHDPRLAAPAPYTRAQMMAEPYTTEDAATARHRRYYAQFVSPGVLQLVASTFGRAAILASRDPHFNDIPLAKWDRLEPSIKDLCLSRMGDVNGAVGIGEYGARRIAWSLSDAVCIAKEAARQLAEQEGSRVWGANK